METKDKRKFTEVIECKGSRFERFAGVEFDQENWENLINKGIMESKEKDKSDDWVTTFPPNYWGQKYAKRMYSKKLDRLRHTTMTEFYGNGIVD